MNLYEELGIGEDATTADIKRAHRQRVSKCHPDAGGERTEFERVQNAYMVLVDPARRQRYDETGETETRPDNTMAEMSELIMTAFDQVLGLVGKDFRQQDLIANTRSLLQQRKQEIVELHAKTIAERAAQEELITRLKFGGDGPDVILGAIRQRLKRLDLQIERTARDEAATDRALAYLDVYAFEFDLPVSEPEFMLFSLAAGKGI